MNTREFVNRDKSGGSLVSPDAETRDSLEMLAVQVLAAQYDLKTMDCTVMVSKLHEIIEELHQAYMVICR